MKNNKTILIVIIIGLVVLIAGAAILYNYLGSRVETENISNTVTQSKQDDSKINLAEDFTMFDAEGNAVKLSDFKGKPVVLNFWASWCGPCKMEMPDFDAAYKEYKDEICFVMVNLTDGSRETIESASAFIEESGYSFPVYYDTDMEAALAYEVYSIPVTYFIDKDGKIEARANSAISENVLKRGISAISE